MNLEQEIQIIEMKNNYEVEGFTNELDKEIPQNKIDETNYTLQIEKISEETSCVEEQSFGEQSPEEQSLEEQPMEEHSIISIETPMPTKEEKEEETSKLPENIGDAKRRKILIFGTATIILIIAIMGIILTNPGGLTGYTTATREIQQATDLNQIFSQYTETQLELNSIISFKISGMLEGTGAKVKLRINGTEYLVADIINPADENQITGKVTEEETPQYTISTDKALYLLGETATITITPEIENKSLYISYGEQTQKLDTNTYLTQNLGEHQAIALIVLPDNILRLETNFTVVNESVNETTPTEEETLPEPAEQETTGYEFSELCIETCTLPETSNPVLIIETAENSTLTITQITTIQTRENNAPVEIQVIPDINLITGETTTLDLNEYFSDTDQDTVQYDINEIPEIDATITQNILAITSETPGIYTAFIYATDGDKLVTSNTFQIIITPIEAGQNQTNETTSTVIPDINITPNETILPPVDMCADTDPNQRPVYCIEGKEEKYYVYENVFLKDDGRGGVARITPIGNMIIKGSLFENSTMNPKTGDFEVTVTNADFKDVPVAWIDSETGNLHIKGKLYEEDFFLSPTSNAFVIQNIRNVNLAYIDRNTGDLHIKGNLIQNKERIE